MLPHSHCKAKYRLAHETILEIHNTQCACNPVFSSVNTFVSLHSWVLALHWARCRIISPVIVREGPGAGGGQGVGLLTSFLERGIVLTRTACRAGAGAGARGGAGGRGRLDGRAVHGGLLRSAAGGGFVLAVLALLSPLLIWITVCVHSHGSVSLSNTSAWRFVCLFVCLLRGQTGKTLQDAVISEQH